MSRLKSRSGEEWVKAPIDIKSTPVPATSLKDCKFMLRENLRNR